MEENKWYENPSLTYDDVLLKPKKSEVKSRKNIDTSLDLSENINLQVPVISANMSTVTEKEMAQAMSDNGGLGIIHRFMSVETQEEQIRDVNGLVGASVGINEQAVENAIKYKTAGADLICVDIAHGHLERCLQTVENLDTALPDDITIVAGNIATKQGAIDLSEAGADVIKVGIGPGSTCITREKTGVGVPQITAIKRVSEALEGTNKNIIADGGIRKVGDACKAIMAGASAIMVGSMVAGCDEAKSELIERNGKKQKVIRGMASKEERKDYKLDPKGTAVEGGEKKIPYTGSVENKMLEFENGFQSSISYCGGRSFEEAKNKTEFEIITSQSVDRNGIH